jgi:bifunctional enzyme CysN/CysC
MTLPANQFQISLEWLSDRALVAGRVYVMEVGAHTLAFNVTAIKYRKQRQTGEHLSAKSINQNESCVLNISTTDVIAVNAGDSLVVVDAQTAEV